MNLSTASEGHVAKAGKQSLRTMAILSTLMAFASISTDMYLPAMPAMAVALGSDAGRLEWSISGYLIGFSLGQLAWGPLSDRYGRRMPIAAGLLLFILGSAGCAMAGSMASLVGWRALQAVGACASVVIARAIVRDLYRGPRAAQLMSTLMTVMAIAPLAGPSRSGKQICLQRDGKFVCKVLFFEFLRIFTTKLDTWRVEGKFVCKVFQESKFVCNLPSTSWAPERRGPLKSTSIG